MRETGFVALFVVVLIATSVGSLGGSAGCGSVVATDQAGVFVPDAKGIYDQFSVTSACSGEFDTVIEIVQSEDNLILQAANSGFSDYHGTIDENGALTLSGSSSSGSSSECTGTFLNGSLSEVCELSLSICTITSPGVETCTDTPVSCSVAYERQ